ncbi:hypothetical protein [Chengkuizengella sediminis]|uniref:hypothetical protein n=1 Tax=Chengkuizengella sediminis TaxID=1885917 RepID=UPI001389CDEC|nr:hypothetical protein [Chengkuizengella sediminis]NDI35747.1 hypothetical protein [Chengkuizengella sediminis]
MIKKVASYILLFIFGVLLSAFSFYMPALGYKNIEYIEQTSSYQITNYSWYGKQIYQETFEGDNKEGLVIYQNQRRIQEIEAWIIFFTIASLVLWRIREKKFRIYGSVFLAITFIVMDIVLVNKLN